MYEQPHLISESIWIPVRDGHATVRLIFDRHYSRRRFAAGYSPAQFMGPGEKLALITPCARAIFLWRKFIDDADDGTGERQAGVNCAAFRNEGAGLSSTLIRAADTIADAKWPEHRHYTYIDSDSVRSRNPGCCFKKAGWTDTGRFTRGGLMILERA